MSELIAELLAAHQDFGLYSDAGGDTHYVCACDKSKRPGNHRDHLADVIAAHLVGVVDGLREEASRAVRAEVLIGPMGPNSRAIHDRGGCVSPNLTEADTAADAVLAVVREALTGHPARSGGAVGDAGGGVAESDGGDAEGAQAGYTLGDYMAEVDERIARLEGRQG